MCATRMQVAGMRGAPPVRCQAPMDEAQVRVVPAGCPSCETEWLENSKQTEAGEQQRLEDMRSSDMKGYLMEIYDYAQRMNDTQRQELALEPDVGLRNFIISSCTPPTPLMEKVYNATMQRVPYEQACYICGPEQAMLLRTLVSRHPELSYPPVHRLLVQAPHTALPCKALSRSRALSLSLSHTLMGGRARWRRQWAAVAAAKVELAVTVALKALHGMGMGVTRIGQG